MSSLGPAAPAKPSLRARELSVQGEGKAC